MDRSGRRLALPDSDSVDIASDGNADSNLEQALNNLNRASSHGPGFIDILNFGFQWGIPSVDLTRIGVLGPSDSTLEGSRMAYTLGAGHTATVIRHETGDEESDLLPNGTTIALKIFAQNPVSETANNQSRDGRSARSQTYHAILRELGVFCHPDLSEHPNIVKLLFLGWQSPNPFPVLGLELGEFGSLDYILRSPGTGLSRLQKAHVTMDVALGLHALHDNDFVHGDLKPANVILLRHADPERQIIAKLTDFGGASRARSLEAPGFVTYLWCAPEVLHGDDDLEWDKCDVYSYGLIVASIWSRPEMFEHEWSNSSCILSSFIPEYMGDEDRENFLLVMKSVGEDSPESALQLTLGTLSEVSEAVAGDVLRATLVPAFWQRPTILDIIVQEFVELAPVIGRNLM